VGPSPVSVHHFAGAGALLAAASRSDPLVGQIAGQAINQRAAREPVHRVIRVKLNSPAPLWSGVATGPGDCIRTLRLGEGSCENSRPESPRDRRWIEGWARVSQPPEGRSKFEGTHVAPLLHRAARGDEGWAAGQAQTGRGRGTQALVESRALGVAGTRALRSDPCER
jgi:hypothetical protein